MIAPQNDVLSEEFPKKTSDKNVFLVHMHKDRIVLVSELPRETLEADGIPEAPREARREARRTLQ